jgi:microsomal prostaglandin-E synthase 2
VLTVNIYRTPRESFQTFEYITDTGKFNFLEREAVRIVGATTMYAISGKLKKKYKIEGDPRAELYSTAEEWVSGLGGRPFMGGDKPNLADISAFGVIRSITCTDTFLDLMHNTKISGWYERMMKAVGDSSRISAS